MPSTAARPSRLPLAKAIPTLTPEGIVTAIVAVTGVEDHVADVIVPGAFRRTLAIRRPKLVFHHDWLRFLGRVLYIEELQPGDKRLPAKQKNGQPWPKDAGALIATMQFNMATEAGRTAYEWARFYSETGECEWSIGYKVVPSKVSKGRGGTRFIYDLDVFEVSLVLFGAASETMTLEVKDARPSSLAQELTGAALPPAALALFEAKALEQAVDANPDGVSVAGLVVRADDTGRVLMLQRWLDPEDPARGHWEFPGGHLDDGEAPYDGAVREWQEEIGVRLPAAAEQHGEWTSPNGVYRGFVVSVPHEAEVDINAAHADREAFNPDDPHGRQIEVAAWFDPQTLPDMPALRAECHDAPWDLIAGDAPSVESPLEGKTAAQAVMEAKQLPSDPIDPATAGAADSELETKSMNPKMTGSYEAVRDALQAAVRELLCKDCADSDACSCDECWICVEATFPERVVVTHCCGSDETTYELPYTATVAEGAEVAIELGQPTPVTLQVVAVPDPDDEQAEEAVADPDTVTMLRLTLPAVAGLNDVAARVLAGGLEGKGMETLRAPLLALIDALAVKGMPVHDMLLGDEEDIPGAPDAPPPGAEEEIPTPAGDHATPAADEAAADPEAETDDADQMQVDPGADEAPTDETPEAAEAAPDGDEPTDGADEDAQYGDDTEGKSLVELDMADVQATLAALRA